MREVVVTGIGIVSSLGNNAMMKLSEFVPATSELTEELINKFFNDDEVVIVNR